MNRFFTTLTVFAMLLLAIGLSVRQTIASGSELPLLAIQAAAGVGLITGCLVLVKKRYFRVRRKSKAAGPAIGQPIRRLL
jgi:hypothetical protein